MCFQPLTPVLEVTSGNASVLLTTTRVPHLVRVPVTSSITEKDVETRRGQAQRQGMISGPYVCPIERKVFHRRRRMRRGRGGRGMSKTVRIGWTHR